jgi:hypothetical protein
VNLNQVKTLAELTAALAALPQYCRRDYLGHGQGWEILRRPPRQSERMAASIGPFDAIKSGESPRILEFSYRAGWTAANVAATMRPYGLGNIGGPHAVALIIDHEQTGAESARAVLIAGATAALTGALS